MLSLLLIETWLYKKMITFNIILVSSFITYYIIYNNIDVRIGNFLGELFQFGISDRESDCGQNKSIRKYCHNVLISRWLIIQQLTEALNKPFYIWLQVEINYKIDKILDYGMFCKYLFPTSLQCDSYFVSGW